MQEKIAIIDLGTNTFHLLIASVENGKSNILLREKQPVKIGLGGINQRLITDEAFHRALECLTKFKRTLTEWNVTRVRALGTSALRNALNGKEVIQKIRNETGIDIKLISGNEEAEFIYYGVWSALDLGLNNSLIVDIGGGSVEFIIGNRSSILWKQSFEIGAQRLLELYHKHDPILAEEAKQLEAHFSKSLTPLQEAIQSFAPLAVIGSSGTFDTLSEIYCIRNNLTYPTNETETPLTVRAFYEIHKELLTKTRTERLQIPGMIEMRVDMIVTASCLIKYLLDTFTFENIRVSSYSLKEGVLARWAEGTLPQV